MPAVYTFKKGPEHKADDAQTAVAKMLQAKTGRNSIDGVFVSTNNLTFFAGVCHLAVWGKFRRIPAACTVITLRKFAVARLVKGNQPCQRRVLMSIS